eukprot:GHVR01158749.1.p1 GENE.GHVR01158749.1~~GHVR01158749.1.p1  ORF type:complete len:195 (-),score=41.25 GHVR01158749.1:422-1006(-)
MGKGPEKVEASEAEKVSAGVAKAEYDRFKQLYDPLLQQMRDKSMTDDYKTTLRGRANADTQQALSGGGFQETQRVDAAGERAAAVQGQLGQATAQAKGIENRMKTGVLGTARGQAAEAQVGMANASRLATSDALTRAKASQDVASAKYRAAGQLAGAAIMGANEKFGGENKTGFSKFLGDFGENLNAQNQGGIV